MADAFATAALVLAGIVFGLGGSGWFVLACVVVAAVCLTYGHTDVI